MIAHESWVHYPDAAETPTRDQIGGKGINLLQLQQMGLDVPRWVAIRTDAFRHFCLPGDDGPETPGTVARLRERTLALELPEDFRSEVLVALREAGLLGVPLALRSSAAAEDGPGASFAGQFDSVLGVRFGEDGAALWSALRQVWASAFGARATAYQGNGTDKVSMAVLVQEMVDAEASGVAFSADPVNGAREIAVVSAVPGLGEALVSGAVDADTFWVPRPDRDGGARRQIVVKERALRMEPGGGTRVVPLPPEQRLAPTLSDAEACRIAALARHAATAFGAPQDVEWALGPDGRRLWVLQTRPITGLPPAPPRTAGERRVWDNSNIVESYGGVTGPLTFSFARSAYEEAYLQFCRVMGVSESLIEEHRHSFTHLLGLFRGRVYYNLLNWYRILALLPGYRWNRAFMERMMGVREALPDPPRAPSAASRWIDLARLLRTGARLVREQRGLRRAVPAFHRRVDAALAPLHGEALERWPAERLATLFHRLEGELLRHWRTPLVNDFFAMIFFGVLGRLTERWLPDAPPSLANDLLCGDGGIVSTEPGRRVVALARRVATDPVLGSAFAVEPDDTALWRRIAGTPELAAFHAEIRAYLDRFGDRCAEELKLETRTPRQDPALLLRTVRMHAARPGVAEDLGTRGEAEVRHAAEREVRARLRGIRRHTFLAVLGQARRRVRDRENLRFERTRVFGLVRRIFCGIGGALAAEGRLDSPDDIFFLTREEVFGHLEGTGTVAELRTLVAVRRAEWDGFRQEPSPPDRFETHGPLAHAAPPAAVVPVVKEGAELRGTACSPGVVRAPVRIIRDPADAGDLVGHILVAERTDPGWTVLFPAALGLLVQRGSLLSHSAIVAREMALPCVVGVPGLLEVLRDDETVEMDGTTGRIRRLAEGEA
jgi:pyruvate,water dikinase